MLMKSELYEKELAQKEAAAEKMVGEGVGFERIRRITGYLVGTLPKEPRNMIVCGIAAIKPAIHTGN